MGQSSAEPGGRTAGSQPLPPPATAALPARGLGLIPRLAPTPAGRAAGMRGPPGSAWMRARVPVGPVGRWWGDSGSPSPRAPRGVGGRLPFPARDGGARLWCRARSSQPSPRSEVSAVEAARGCSSCHVRWPLPPAAPHRRHRLPAPRALESPPARQGHVPPRLEGWSQRWGPQPAPRCPRWVSHRQVLQLLPGPGGLASASEQGDGAWCCGPAHGGQISRQSLTPRQLLHAGNLPRGKSG